MNADGYVVLADTFYPGWEATVDGIPAGIKAANGLFRAVFVGSGAHRVRFDYRPRALYWGAAVSAVALVACIALAGRRSKEP